MEKLRNCMPIRLAALLCCLALFVLAAGMATADDATVTYGHYWQQIQARRTIYESRLSEIREQYPDYESNPQAHREMRRAEQEFSAARNRISNDPSFKTVVADPEVEKKFWQQQHSDYQKKHTIARKRLNAQLAAIRKRYPDPANNPVAQLEIQKVTSRYYERSRKLAVTYQKNIQDMIRDELTRKTARGTGKVSAPIKETAGSGYYEKDPQTGAIRRDKDGNPMINPKHRGHSGDTDVEAGARTADARTIRKILREKGLGDIPVDDNAGYVSIGEGKDGINLTINKSGEKFGPVGSSAHQSRIAVDAESKETYVHIGMKEDQPGRSYVAVQDHKKKALKGLTTDPVTLVDGHHADALQGMAKGTLKSMQEADLSDSDLKKIIRKNKLQETPASLRRKLAQLKEGQAIAPDGVGLNRKNIGRYQQASREIIEAAEQKTRIRKDREMATAQKKIRQLEASGDPGDRKRARELRKEVVDAKVRIESTEAANKKKAAGTAADENDATHRSPRAGKKIASADGPESSGRKNRKKYTGSEGGKGKGRTKMVSSGRSESGIIKKTVIDDSQKTTVYRDSSEETRKRQTTTTTGPGGSSITDTRSTENTTAGGHRIITSTTTTHKEGILSSEESGSTTKTVRTAGGTRKTSNTSHSEKRGLLGTTRTSAKSTTLQKRDSYGTTTGEETATIRIRGGMEVTRTTKTTGRSWTNKSGSITAQGSHSHTTTKIGNTEVGQAHTLHGGIMGKFGDSEEEVKEPRRNISIKLADNVQVDEHGTAISQGGGATRMGEHGELSGDYKVETGHTKHQYGTTITIEHDGSVKVEYVNQYEKNALKVTAGGKGTYRVGKAAVGVETKGEFTAGGRIGFKANVEAGPDGIKSQGEVDIFIGMKAEGQISGSLDMKDYIGVGVKGTLNGYLSAGAGAQAGYEAELSWTGIKMSGKLAATLGLGAGGQGSVEIDVSVLTTGVDLEKVAQQDKENVIIREIIKAVKIGQVKLPPGKRWKDILPEMHKKVEWLARHPEVLAKDKKAYQEILKSLRFEKGKRKQKFISIRKHQKDWYCTNRPVISSRASMPDMLRAGH